jgi:hypothetical protein
MKYQMGFSFRLRWSISSGSKTLVSEPPEFRKTTRIRSMISVG